MTPEGHPIPREAMHRIDSMPRCSGGSCRQGRSRCETPEACCTPIDDDEMTPAAKAIVIGIFLGFAFFALAAAVLPIIFNWRF